MRTCPKEHVKVCFQRLPFHSPFQTHGLPEAVSAAWGSPGGLQPKAELWTLQPSRKHIRTFPPYKLRTPRAFLSLISQRGKTKTARVFLLPVLKVFAFQKEKVWMMHSHKGQISKSGMVGSLTLPVGRYLENVFQSHCVRLLPSYSQAQNWH